ncbi:hypothetical protein J3R82DRAFT_9935 [Butyriboletus roseoflavus]|nr:hypothetical protein J3R82DRAFT_9935 [Butyriboletus roseoflavus]
MSQAAVDVSGFSPFTSETELHDFFSFCGMIKSIELKGGEGEPRVALITFEKHSAANTALMLNGGNLGGNTLTVTSEVDHTGHHDAEEHHHHIEQSDKPRAGIAAEYLAKGYKLSDHILQRAIEIDNKQGISTKFLSFISDLDKSVGQRTLGPDQTVSGKVQSTFKEAHTRAKSIDEQKGYSKTAHGYYAKALASPLGQSVLSFYTSTSKQVRDIHEEAVRIKEHKATPPTSPPAPAPASPSSTSAQPEASK